MLDEGETTFSLIHRDRRADDDGYARAGTRGSGEKSAGVGGRNAFRLDQTRIIRLRDSLILHHSRSIALMRVITWKTSRYKTILREEGQAKPSSDRLALHNFRHKCLRQPHNSWI